MVRQRWLGGATRRLALAGAAVAVGTLAGCGGDSSSRIAAEGVGESTYSDEAAPARDVIEQETVTVGTELPASPAGRQVDAAESVTRVVESAEDAVNGFSPEGASTGPLLQWSEFHPGIDQPGALYSIGDGRVVIGGEGPSGAPRLMVTPDGTDWSEIQLPVDIWPSSLDLDGERWAIAGWLDNNPPGDDLDGRIFVSDDEGSTWSEMRPNLAPRELPEHTIAYSSVAAVATSGPQVVAVIRTHVTLDVEALLRDRGLLSSGARPQWISVVGDGISIDLLREPASDGAQSDRASPTPDAALTFTFDELGLSADQVAFLNAAGDVASIRVLSGSGSELTEAAVLDGHWAGGIGTDDGFVLLVESDRDGVTMFTSSDGLQWTSHAVDLSSAQGWFSGAAFESDGTVWMTSSDGTGSELTRWRTGGSDVWNAWLGNFRRFDEFSAGPAGLATTAIPSPLEPPAGSSDGPGLPVGRVVKDGYELRYGEPEGGITLWDLIADAAVYVFGPEIIESNELPEGVREVEEGDVFELTFEDPDTGDDLVTFTMEDLEEVFGEQIEPPDSSYPDMWVGWSANGTDWGWQSVRDAFGLGDVDARAIVAVGEDFVIASVQVFPPVESDAPATGGGEVATHMEMTPRWFIARVP